MLSWQWDGRIVTKVFVSSNWCLGHCHLVVSANYAVSLRFLQMSVLGLSEKKNQIFLKKSVLLNQVFSLLEYIFWLHWFLSIFDMWQSNYKMFWSPINLFTTSESPKYSNSNSPNLLLWFFCLIKSRANCSGITQPFLNLNLIFASNCLLQIH